MSRSLESFSCQESPFVVFPITHAQQWFRAVRSERLLGKGCLPKRARNHLNLRTFTFRLSESEPGTQSCAKTWFSRSSAFAGLFSPLGSYLSCFGVSEFALSRLLGVTRSFGIRLCLIRLRTCLPRFLLRSLESRLRIGKFTLGQRFRSNSARHFAGDGSRQSVGQGKPLCPLLLAI